MEVRDATRYKQTVPLHDRLIAWASEVREQAAKLPPGPERDDLLKRARQADAALHLEDWARSAGPPK